MSPRDLAANPTLVPGLGHMVRFESGDLRGYRYHFTSPDDCLDWHTHTPENEHLTIVTSGTLEVMIGEEVFKFYAGDIVEFDAGVPHKLRGHRAEFVNIIKQARHGKPD